MQVSSLPSYAFSILVSTAFLSTATADLIGHWAFDEGSGTTAGDSSPGAANPGVIANATWGADGTRDSFLIFNGTDSVVDPSLTLPLMTDTNDFTWAFWVNSQEEIGSAQQNAIIVGNRRDGAGSEIAPTRNFIKFTPTKFEWHENGGASGGNQDYDDLVVGEWHHIAVVKIGTGVQYYRDGVAVGAVGTVGTVPAFSAQTPLFIGGEPGETNREHFNGFIDDVRIYDEALDAAAIAALIGDFTDPPEFSISPFAAPDATAAVEYSSTIAGAAVDPDGGTVTYSLLDDPAWLAVAGDGALSGTPALTDVGYNHFLIEAGDGGSSSTAILVVRVIDPAAPPVSDGLFGSWPLDDGAGDVARDSSGNHLDAFVTNHTSGGLGLDGAVWVEDPEFGTVLSFNGADGTGAFATVGAPPVYGQLPVMTLDNDFTWSLWAKPDQEPNNDLILGNRYSADGSEFAPREFTKFTSAGFEFDATAAAHVDIDYDDLPTGAWIHLVVVKQGANLSYFQNGVSLLAQTITQAQNNPQPLYFGGFGSENWRGSLSDVRLFNRALSAPEVTALYQAKRGSDAALRITAITIAPDGDVTLSWNSVPDAVYAVDYSFDLINWPNHDGAIPSGGTSTSITLDGEQVPLDTDPAKIFFRARDADE